MTVKEFFDLCALKGCDGVVIVNELADDFTYGNVIDIISHESSIPNFRHTFHDFQRLYGFDREILGFGVSNWNGCEGAYIRMKLKGISSDYDVDLGHHIVTVDKKKYVSYLHDESGKYDYFKLLESEVK